MNLKIAIYGGELPSEVLKEMLNHQGVIFEDFDDKREYPCVISTCGEHEYISHYNVIVLDEIVPMDKMIFALSGTLDKPLIEPEVISYEVKLIEEIKKVLFEQNLPFIRKWFWPDFAKYCCIITHDIDRISILPNAARKETSHLIKALMYVAYYLQKYILKKKKFKDYIDLIIGLENKHNVKSSFYFFPDYTAEDHGDFIKILDKLKKGNFEVGLHSRSTNLEQLEKEKQELEKNLGEKIFGTRQHALKFSVPQTWKYQEKLMNYDLSFYCNKDFGFRSGLCFPYRPLNTNFIIEIPTSFMDWTALDKGMTYEQIREELSNIIKQIEKYNGCLVLNFHNEYFSKWVFPHIYKTFTDTLEYIQKKDYWVTTARKCVGWWKKRESVEIDIRLEKTKIVGTSSDEVPLIIEYKNGNIDYLNVKNNFSVDCSK